MVTPAKSRPGTREDTDVATVPEDDVATDAPPWVTLVWDDPVNLMTYVTYVLQKLFGYSEPHATKLMLQVHNEGKAVVSAAAGNRWRSMCPSSTPQGCGRRCNRTADPAVRKWKRVEASDGPRFRSALAAHEAELLSSLVTSLLGMLEDRQSSAPPADELADITGIRPGNSVPPQDDTMKRLLPDFYRPATDHPAVGYRREPQQRAAGAA